MVGILAILAGALLAPPEMGWPKELLAPILLLWMGLCSLAGGFKKGCSREYERKTGRLDALLGGALIGIYVLPVDWKVQIFLTIAVGIPVVAAVQKAYKTEKQRVTKD